MSFKKKSTVKNNFESYRVEAKVMHGDGDLYETLILGPFSKEQFPEVVGIQKAFEEMITNDKETGNKQEYEYLPYFRGFLMRHWKYDVFARECDIYRYVMVIEYSFFYTDKDGNEYEIEELSFDNCPKNYYIKLLKSDNYIGVYDEEIIMTYSSLEKELQLNYGLFPLENGEELVSKFYIEEEIDVEDWSDESDFVIIKHFRPSIKDEEMEISYYDEIEKLENKFNINI